MNNKEIYENAPEYCGYFFDLIETDDLLSEFEKSKKLTLDVFNLVPSDLENFSYQSGKWTVKEVLRHIIDMERIFAYRAFRFSRLDSTDLSGVEENDYVKNARQTGIKLSELSDEYVAVRNSTMWIYKNLNPEMLDFKSTANAQTYTARTLGFSMVGHNIHHCNFIKMNYLNRE